MNEFKIYEPQDGGRAATLMRIENQRPCYGYETRLVGLRRLGVHGSAKRLQNVGKREGEIVYAK